MAVFFIKKLLFKGIYKIALGLKTVVRPLLSPEQRQKFKKMLLKKAYPLKNNESSSEKHFAGNFGVNLIGYARAEMGIGESCRIAAKSLDAGNIPFGILNYTGTNKARMGDLSWGHKEIGEPSYMFNVFHLNAEQMMEAYAHYGDRIFNGRYNIGFWHWELPEFPDEWLENMNLVDEIWVPSTFVADSIAAKSRVPVVKIPHSIEVKIDEPRSREYFGLPQDPFLFLCMYDLKSYQERKNPMGAIKAFQSAFDRNDDSVGLVVKVNGLHDGDKDTDILNEIAAGYRNIHFIKQTLSRSDTNALLQAVDSFVSLHRSEGFGLGLAEAMYLGKPVIGTGWSSNIDFMNAYNSCIVDYELIPVGQDHGPYKKEQLWAEPNLGTAASYMGKIFHDVTFRELIASNGQITIREEFSPQAVSKKIKRRLDYINLWNSGGLK